MTNVHAQNAFGPVAHWDFNGATQNGYAQDMSGNNHNATIHGATFIPDRFGTANAALAFDGNDWLDVPYSNSLVPQDHGFTHSMWVKFDSTSMSSAVYSNGNADYSGGFLSLTYYINDLSSVFLHSWWGSNFYNDNSFSLPTTLYDNTWHQIITVIDGQNITMYIDNLYVVEKYWAGGYKPYDASRPIFIGCNFNSYAGGKTDFLTGSIDDIYVYDRALTAQEVGYIFEDNQDVFRIVTSEVSPDTLIQTQPADITINVQNISTQQQSDTLFLSWHRADGSFVTDLAVYGQGVQASETINLSRAQAPVSSEPGDYLLVTKYGSNGTYTHIQETPVHVVAIDITSEALPAQTQTGVNYPIFVTVDNSREALLPATVSVVYTNILTQQQHSVPLQLSSNNTYDGVTTFDQQGTYTSEAKIDLTWQDIRGDIQGILYSLLGVTQVRAYDEQFVIKDLTYFADRQHMYPEVTTTKFAVQVPQTINAKSVDHVELVLKRKAYGQTPAETINIPLTQASHSGISGQWELLKTFERVGEYSYRFKLSHQKPNGIFEQLAMYPSNDYEATQNNKFVIHTPYQQLSNVTFAVHLDYNYQVIDGVVQKVLHVVQPDGSVNDQVFDNVSVHIRKGSVTGVIEPMVEVDDNYFVFRKVLQSSGSYDVTYTVSYQGTPILDIDRTLEVAPMQFVETTLVPSTIWQGFTDIPFRLNAQGDISLLLRENRIRAEIIFVKTDENGQEQMIPLSMKKNTERDGFFLEKVMHTAGSHEYYYTVYVDDAVAYQSQRTTLFAQAPFVSHAPTAVTNEFVQGVTNLTFAVSADPNFVSNSASFGETFTDAMYDVAIQFKKDNGNYTTLPLAYDQSSQRFVLQKTMNDAKTYEFRYRIKLKQGIATARIGDENGLLPRTRTLIGQPLSCDVLPAFDWHEATFTGDEPIVSQTNLRFAMDVRVDPELFVPQGDALESVSTKVFFKAPNNQKPSKDLQEVTTNSYELVQAMSLAGWYQYRYEYTVILASRNDKGKPNKVVHKSPFYWVFIGYGDDCNNIVKPGIIPREAWCTDGRCDDARLDQTIPTHIVIHHTAVNKENETSLESVQREWRFHYSRITGDNFQWKDLAYNYMIGSDGIIYEGRKNLSDSQEALGYHTTFTYEATVGIALIGNFEEKEPTEESLSSLKALTTWLCKKYNIAPHQLNKDYEHSSVITSFNSISGHNDADDASTCPGKNLESKINEIKLGTLNCSNSQTTNNLNKKVSIVKDSENTEISVYPNPSNEKITVVSNKKIKSIRLSDVYGKVHIDFLCEDNAIILDISFLSKGVYFILVDEENTLKFIKN